MRLPARQTAPRRMIGLTPLVDVVFILLIFFMLASSFLDWRAIELKLAAAGRTDVPDKAALVVSIEAAGGLRLNGRPVDREELESEVTAQTSKDPDRPILLRAGDSVPLYRSIAILDAITAAGSRNVSISRAGKASP